MEETGPNVFIPPQLTNLKKPQLGRFLTFRNLLLVFAVILFVEVGLLIFNMFKTTTQTGTSKSQVTTQKVTLSLSVPSQSYKVGDTIPVLAKLSTAGHSVTSTDLILKYDPNMLSATTSAVANGSIFQEYPASLVDSQNGMLGVSGVSSTGGFTGNGDFVTVNFKALKSGRAKIEIDFKANSTADSNVVDASTISDILEKTNDVIVQVQ